MAIYLSTSYLGPIEYYSKFFYNDLVYIEQEETYIKQSYRNRCNILSSNGIIPLSIPIESTGGLKTSIKDMRISSHGNWQHLHWNAIISAYNSTPFFEFYRDYFEPFYLNKFDFLFEFNEQLRLLIFELLELDCSVSYTEQYLKHYGDFDFRNKISPKNKVEEFDSDFVSTPYYQVFDHKFGFSANLSIIDLLFNMGNESLLVLQNSIKKTS